MNMPKWMERLLDSVCSACVNDGKGRMSGFSCQWAQPRNNVWHKWLLEIAPSVLEISGGKDDGTTGFDFVDVDLMALPKCLDEVESFTYDSDDGEQPHLLLVGKKGKKEVVVEVYLTPFDDEEPETIFDVNLGTWRRKQADGD